MTPILENLSNKYEGQVKVIKVDIEQSPELVKKYDIKNIPYVIVFKNGKRIKDMVGFSGKAKVENLFENLVNDYSKD